MSGSKSPSKSAKRLSNLPNHKTYAVGHGKPPKATQFKPGQSGNPTGRPKGKKNKPEAPQHERLKSIILEEAYRSIKVNDGPKQVSVPMAQAVMRSLAVTAAKGNTRAQKLFSELLINTELCNKQAEDDIHVAMIEYKTDWEIELENRKAQGITTLLDPLPHPDDIIVDLRRNTVVVHGPMDKRELAELDLCLQRKNDFVAELLNLEMTIKNQLDSPFLDYLKQEVFYTKRMIEIIDKALKTRATPNCIQRRIAQLNLKAPNVVGKLALCATIET